MRLFANYLRIACRNLWKHKIFSFIKLAGLALGIAAIILP